MQPLMKRPNANRFAHLWGKWRKRRWAVRQFTAKVPFALAVKSVWDWSRIYRHIPIEDQQRHLASVIRGNCACYGLTGNGKRPSVFREAVTKSWRRWLGRCHRDGWISWERFNAILARFLVPTAKTKRPIHSA